MFQKRNDLEVVDLLQKEPQHLRVLAKNLSVPLSTLMRVLHSLVEENVIDYKQQGRNKEYFLKDTPEREVYQFMAEKYKKLKILQKPILRKLIQELLLQTKNNELVVLFGSYAKGFETSQSDIDIYIETSDTLLKKNIAQISDKISVKIGNFENNSHFGKEIIKSHIILQNVDRYFWLIK